MPLYSPGEITELRSFHYKTLADSCIVQSFSEGAQDSYGQKSSPIYTDGTEIACSFWYTKGMETRPINLETTVFKTDAGLRLPAGTSVTEKDRIKITKRYGVALQTPLVFEVVSPIREGQTGIVLDLQIIEP